MCALIYLDITSGDNSWFAFYQSWETTFNRILHWILINKAVRTVLDEWLHLYEYIFYESVDKRVSILALYDIASCAAYTSLPDYKDFARNIVGIPQTF